MTNSTKTTDSPPIMSNSIEPNLIKATARASECIAATLRSWALKSNSKKPLEEIAKSLETLAEDQKEVLQNLKPIQATPQKKTFFTLFITLLTLATIVAVTILLVNQSNDASVEVSVTYDIAELIAAILGGGGIAAAGIGYGIKSLQVSNVNTKPESKD